MKDKFIAKLLELLNKWEAFIEVEESYGGDYEMVVYLNSGEEINLGESV